MDARKVVPGEPWTGSTDGWRVSAQGVPLKHGDATGSRTRFFWGVGGGWAALGQKGASRQRRNVWGFRTGTRPRRAGTHAEILRR